MKVISKHSLETIIIEHIEIIIIKHIEKYIINHTRAIMHDATETADTISHEYRHKYQHERADKLETERDLQFKEGFENYIRAEDDYQGYKEQLVEADARAYAQNVKDKISSYSKTSSENINLNGEQRSLGAEYTKLNPEKGAVFEKVAVDELPDDFEQKDRIKYKEVLEAKELDELRDVASVHYENGKQLGDKVPEFITYKEHHDIESGHIEKVRVKSLEAADALEAHFSQNDYDGLYSPNINRRTIEVMSIYHDTGMDGNIKAEDYEAEREAFISDEAQREKYVSNALTKKEKNDCILLLLFAYFYVLSSVSDGAKKNHKRRIQKAEQFIC